MQIGWILLCFLSLLLNSYSTYKYCKYGKIGSISLETGPQWELSVDSSNNQPTNIFLSDGMMLVMLRKPYHWLIDMYLLLYCSLKLFAFARKCLGGVLVLQSLCSLLGQKLILVLGSSLSWNCLLIGQWSLGSILFNFYQSMIHILTGITRTSVLDCINQLWASVHCISCMFTTHLTLWNASCGWHICAPLTSLLIFGSLI